MSRNESASTVIYPVLGSSLDLWFLRVSGHGLGNCFFAYFHAVALADSAGAAVIAPPWFSLKVGPLLRGSRSKRLYWRMFKPFDLEIHGIRKFIALLGSIRNRAVVKVNGGATPQVVAGAVNFLISEKFTFNGLHGHRATIRQRLLGVVRHPVPSEHRWGRGNYIAVHIRLGDFAAVADASLIKSGKPNLRIPLEWYVTLVSALRKRYAERPIYIFSDGEESALRPLLEQGATLYRSGSDITDLLAMAGASILVGSNSTYSHWAAFLGDMPSIWLETTVRAEKPSGPDTPILYIALEAAEPALWR